MTPVEILLIEDDIDDVELLQEALNSRKVAFHMRVIRDGSAAVEYFRQDTDIPDIIIMDFNLPRVHGREVIRRIREMQKFCGVPILILSTSSLPTDISFAYDSGADKYLVKPATIEAINDTVRTILELTGRTSVAFTK